jgi:hypothetical protein
MFSICYLRKVKLREAIFIRFNIKADVEFTIYTKGQEFWLSLVGFPPSFASAKLNSFNEEGLTLFIISELSKTFKIIL